MHHRAHESPRHQGTTKAPHCGGPQITEFPGPIAVHAKNCKSKGAAEDRPVGGHFVLRRQPVLACLLERFLVRSWLWAATAGSVGRKPPTQPVDSGPAGKRRRITPSGSAINPHQQTLNIAAWLPGALKGQGPFGNLQDGGVYDPHLARAGRF